jgi:hypothetical protein
MLSFLFYFFLQIPFFQQHHFSPYWDIWQPCSIGHTVSLQSRQSIVIDGIFGWGMLYPWFSHTLQIKLPFQTASKFFYQWLPVFPAASATHTHTHTHTTGASATHTHTHARTHMYDEQIPWFQPVIICAKWNLPGPQQDDLFVSECLCKYTFISQHKVTTYVCIFSHTVSYIYMGCC